MVAEQMPDALDQNAPVTEEPSLRQPNLITIHEQTHDRLDLTLGGMKEVFENMEPNDRELVEAIQYERFLIALHLDPAHESEPTIFRMAKEMYTFAESDRTNPEPYVRMLIEAGPRFRELLPRRPHTLPVGNMPGKLDRMDVTPVVDNLRKAEKLINDMLPNDPSFRRFRLAISECVTNHILHGMGSDPRQTARIRCVKKDTKFGIAVRDSGWGYRPELVRDATLPENLEKPDGRGLMLMESGADRKSIFSDGRLSAMVKLL